MSRKPRVPRHATNPAGDREFTLCGDSFDIGDTENEEGVENPTFAEPGRAITCAKCIEVITHCRRLRIGKPVEPQP